MVFLGEKELELREFPDPIPGPGEVVLEIKASGMCGSDLNFYRASRGGGAGSLGLGGDGEPVIALRPRAILLQSVAPRPRRQGALRPTRLWARGLETRARNMGAPSKATT